jgi:hypothetical protein
VATQIVGRSLTEPRAGQSPFARLALFAAEPADGFGDRTILGIAGGRVRAAANVDGDPCQAGVERVS